MTLETLVMEKEIEIEREKKTIKNAVMTRLITVVDWDSTPL